MSFWGAIKKSVNSNLSTPLDTQMSSMESRLNMKINNFTVPVVKSVQRGVANVGIGTGDPGITVTINAVNTSKSLIFLNGQILDYGGDRVELYVSAFSSTSFTALLSSMNTTRSGTVSWQVIEFY